MVFMTFRKGRMEKDLDRVFKSVPKNKTVFMKKIRKDKKKFVFDINF